MSTQPEMYLQEMGLPEYEAATYVGLLDGGTSTAKEVAERAGVPQSRVYDVLERYDGSGGP